MSTSRSRSILLAVGALAALLIVGGIALLTGEPGPTFDRPSHEDFPVLVTDGSASAWMVRTDRTDGPAHLVVERVWDGGREAVTVLAAPGGGTIGPPAVAMAEDGLRIAAAVESGDDFELAVWGVHTSGTFQQVVQQSVGSIVRAPAIAAVGPTSTVVFESNRELPRGIYAVTCSGVKLSHAVRISAPDVASSGPAIVRSHIGATLAVWTSVRNGNMDLYGAWGDDGNWGPEFRLTDDPRMERRPSLTAIGSDVWLAWEAHAFHTLLVTAPGEQLVAVARLDGGKLRAARGVFTAVTRRPDAKFEILSRPRLSADPDGRLWLTARRSLGQHHGFGAAAWCYSGGTWSAAQELLEQRGRRRGAPIAWTEHGPLAAVQRDDLPTDYDEGGKDSGWHREIAIVAVDVTAAPAPAPLQDEPLAFPATDFDLAAYRASANADMARQSREIDGSAMGLYFGDFHAHSDVSVCMRALNPSIPDLYVTHRDVDRLDFLAITDHGYCFDAPQWAYSSDQVRAHHDEGRFLTFLAEEWTSDIHDYDPPRDHHRYGHHNLIFRDPRHPRFYDAWDADITPTALREELGDTDYILIPHQLADLGNCPTDWDHHDSRAHPVAEIYQQRGSYEALGAKDQATNSMQSKGHFLQDAWARGLIVGVIASSDHGGGAGKMGVWAPELTRDAIFEAIRARRTFGTSGPKMGLFVTANGHAMGSVVPRGDGPIELRVEVVTDQPSPGITIVRNNIDVDEPLTEESPAGTLGTVTATWTDESPPGEDLLWYYVRVTREDGQMAWSSPIWFRK